MIGHDQSSPATDHRFCPIIGCSASAGLDGDPSDPTVTPSGMKWGHGIIYAFQWLDHEVTPVTPQNTKRLYGKHKAATALPLGRLHVSGGNIGKVGSLGSLGSPLVAADHRLQPIIAFPYFSCLFLLLISPAYFSCLFPLPVSPMGRGTRVMGHPGGTRGVAQSDHRFPPIWNGSFPMGPGRGDSDPRKNTLCKNFRLVRHRNVTT